MSKGFFEIMLDRVCGGSFSGYCGEVLSELNLNFTRILGIKGRTLRNLYIPKYNGETTEIDVVFITLKGIFVIESKNYSGWIYGNENSMYWTSALANGQKNQFYNPVKQNRSHIRWLKEYLKTEIPMYSVIVFSNRCVLKKISVSGSDAKVIQREMLPVTVMSIWKSADDALNAEQAGEIYNRLRGLANADKSVKTAHIENIRRKYGNAAPDDSVPEESKICPVCGGNLVIRTARKGRNAGKDFYGCENFPQCKYTENI